MPTLLDEPTKQEQHPYLYWELHGGQPRQAVRFGRYKAIRNPLGSGKIKLYDLEDDIGESQDLATIKPAIVKQASQYLKEAHRESPIWKDIP